MNHDIIIGNFRLTASGLFRQPSGCLRHPFIVPGAQYSAELWDWDAYWTTLGLLYLARASGDEAIRDEAVRHGQGSLLNFFEYQAVSGAIPIMMKADNPDVFECIESQGIERNHAKPVFGQFALALVNAARQGEGGGGGGGSDLAFVKTTITALDRFYSYWEIRYRHAGTGLLVWGSDVAIGVDNDPTTYARPPFSSANLMLNCLYHADLEAAAVLAERIGENSLAVRWRARAAEISQAIRTYCWDERDAFFYTLDVQCADHRARLIPWAKPGAPLAWSALPMRIQMFTGFLPLWRGIATAEQAAALCRHALDENTFAAPTGIRSLSPPRTDVLTRSEQQSEQLERPGLDTEQLSRVARTPALRFHRRSRRPGGQNAGPACRRHRDAWRNPRILRSRYRTPHHEQRLHLMEPARLRNAPGGEKISAHHLASK